MAGSPLPGQSVFAVADARVDIVMDTARVARVRATYTLGQDASLPSFQYLTAPCTSIEAISVSLAGAGLELTAAARGPWVAVVPNPAGPRARAGDTVLVSHVVRLSAGSGSIPLVMPAAPLSRAAILTLSLLGTRARPLWPFLTRSPEPDMWSTTSRALPSLVRVDPGPPSDATCAAIAPRHDAGDFGARFGVFVLTLLLWIPLYFWWALRQTDPR
jgi:hypothetical protein